ncbi:MAG: hypothetical protein WAV28_07945 [Sedimentisphaerales bacterium]
MDKRIDRRPFSATVPALSTKPPPGSRWSGWGGWGWLVFGGVGEKKRGV